MSKIVFFASTPISHIIPLKPIFEYLKQNNHEIHCFSDLKNKEIIMKMGALFHEYPEGIYRELGSINTSYSVEASKLWSKNKMIEGYEFYLEKDTEYFYNIGTSKIIEMKSIIEQINPEVIFRDSTDKIGYYVTNLSTRSPMVIGYITHNLYSKSFFDQNPRQLYSLLMNAKIDKNEGLASYFENYRERVSFYNEKIANEKNVPKLNILHQFDPMTKYTIIFSTDYFQPSCAFDSNRDYQIIYPEHSRFQVEENIDNNLENFINQNSSPIIYIASGSIISYPLERYINYLLGLTQSNCRVIISCKNYYKELNEMVKYVLKKENVYIDQYVPQKYVLSKSNLFISSGGQNSIIESIYFQIPLLIDPITSEQRLNGILVEELDIGRTLAGINSRNTNVGKIINDIFKSSTIKKNLQFYSKDIEKHENDFSFLENIFNDLKGKKYEKD